jgi:hypothetical protein
MQPDGMNSLLGVSILDPNCFWNIVLLAGVVLMVLSVLTGPVGFKFGKRSLEGTVEKDPQQRRPLLWIGLVMSLVAIAFMAFTNWGGLVSPIHNGKPKGPDEHTSLHLVPAPASLAQISVSTSEPKPLATLTIVARHEIRAPQALGSDVIVYVGAINLLGRSRLLIYRSDSPPSQGEIHYHLLRPKLLKEQIIWDGDVSNKQTIAFTWNGQNYRVIIELNWFLRGDNYAVINLYKR